MFTERPPVRRADLDARPHLTVVMDDMNKHLFARPEVLIPCLFLLWFASAAAYALVFTY